MNSILVVWGTGGHGKVVLDVARSTKRFEVILFVDDDPTKAGTSFCDCEIIGKIDSLKPAAGMNIVVAIGSNRIRARCFDRAVDKGFAPTSIIHPSAIVASSARLAAGTVVMPGAIINAGAIIEENCIVNTGAIVEHDCRIATHCHISPRVALGGGVRVGPLVHIGLGAVVLPMAIIGEESVVGAGAVVLRGTGPRTTVVGVPAKSLPLEVEISKT